VLGLGFVALLAWWTRPNAVLATRASPVASVSGEEFVSIFNGTDLTDWKARTGIASDWSVEDRCLVCQATAPGWLRYRQPLRDFVLR
ncbi:family 16 glycoside hydrolase, partial [Acinetobacter baumannii]